MLYVSGDAVWQYAPAPKRKCLLLNMSGCLMQGPPLGEWMVEYIAWSPMPKRDKEMEDFLLRSMQNVSKTD